MMPYIVGKDAETGELLVGDKRSSSFFLRGQPECENEIRNLVQAANQWLHEKQPSGGQSTA